MIKVKAIEVFKDEKSNVTRLSGEEFEVTKERYEELLKKKWIESKEENNAKKVKIKKVEKENDED